MIPIQSSEDQSLQILDMLKDIVTIKDFYTDGQEIKVLASEREFLSPIDFEWLESAET